MSLQMKHFFMFGVEIHMFITIKIIKCLQMMIIIIIILIISKQYYKFILNSQYDMQTKLCLLTSSVPRVQTLLNLFVIS